MTARLEIAAVSAADALAAAEGGADSIEISRDLSVGGLTPALEVVTAALAAVSIPIHVMIRPHGRGFVYNADEQALIFDQIAQFRALRVSSLVFGAQRTDGTLDVGLIERAATAAYPLPITLHRALDTCRQPENALAALCGTLPRILTAGDGATAWDGRHTLKRWVARFGGSLRFVASGGVTFEQVRPLLAFTGAHEVHLGKAARTGDAVDAAKVAALRELLIAAS